MMLTIQGLPTSTSYQELKRLIKQECNITDFILDSLVMDDDGCKKVRIGVTDDGDGSHLMKYLNGYHYSGHVIRVNPVGKPNQQNQVNFDTRAGYQPRHDYQNNNFGNRSVPLDSQQPRSNNWVPNAQWGQGVLPQTPQHTLPNQPIQPLLNNNFTQQQPRGFISGGVSQHQQNFNYQSKSNIPDHPVPITGPFHHQPVIQGHFQGQSHIQSQWSTTQVQSQVKPQSNTGGYNQISFNENRQISKQGMGNDGNYKEYDKSDRRFVQPTRDSSPGRRPSRMSPDRSGRRMSPTGSQGRRMSPPGPQSRRMSPPGHQIRRMSPPGHQSRRMSPPTLGPASRRMSPGNHGRRMSPTRMGGSVPVGRGMSPSSGRRMSPARQGISPHGHKLSPIPHGRRMSPTSYHRASPSGPQNRRISPPGPHGQRVSPHGVTVRRMSPSSRRLSPGRRESSPSRRMSPSRRRASPGRQSPGRRSSPSRRMSPKRHSTGRRSVSPRRRSPLLDAPAGMRGYPPSFQQTKKTKYDDDGRPSHLKQVRPAYEPPTKAPNQPIYSGGYRPNVRENVQYPASSTRLDPWQQSNDKAGVYPPSKNIDNRVEKFEMSRGSEHMRMGDAVPKRSRSGTRDSRSPTRRDRSPLKDRYRRHSPSPRSPRRSWALEKRRSPDDREAPPPPSWPGQSARDNDFPRQNRQHFVDEKIEKKPVPNWDRHSYDDKIEAHRREKIPEPKPFAQNKPVEKWKSVSQTNHKESLSRNNFREDDRFAENIRDSRSFISKEQFRRQNSEDHMPFADKRDFIDYPMKKDDHDELRHKTDFPSRRDDFSRGDEREPFRTNTAQLNKEIEDVYKRVAELGKKAQEYRKKESRFENNSDDQFFSVNVDALLRGKDTRREFHADIRFDPRDDEALSRQSNDGNPSIRQRESRWSALDTSEVWRPRKPLSPTVKAKRDKATEELTRRIMTKFKEHIREHQKIRVHDELTLTISRILFDMFKYEDISYIELIIKFNKKYDANDEKKILEEVISSFSSNYRKQRHAQDQTEVPVKTSKLSPDNLMTDETKGVDFPNFTPQAVPEWNTNSMPVVNVNLPVNSMHSAVAPVPTGKPLAMPVPFMMNPAPMMIPAQSYVPIYENPHQSGLLPDKGGYTLYLCKDDFQPFHEMQADELKTYLVSKMFKETESSQGWAPDFIMKGLQSVYRYEVLTHDEPSKDWLLNLDFSDFYAFNILVYTSEELWYERAAIWLPGHSRYRHIEPLQKLKLQNRKMDGVNIGKWKFVKKVVTTLGTRIYVDMPPSAARALENYKMMLSYELQKVTVFLKAVAVDKDAFDAGLNEPSIEILPSTQNNPMPALTQDPNIIKIGVKGNKSATISMARKIKDMVVYQLFQYLQQGGNSSTDFLKYGFCSPGHLGVIPENTESKRWITGLNLGRLNRQPIIVLGGDDSNVRYIKMYIMLPNEHNTVNSALACEKLKQSNQGVKGLNFSAWKYPRVTDRHEGKTKLEVHMDLESVETIVKMDYELDYVDEDQDCLSVVVKCDYTRGKLEELIKQYKAEMTDSYDVANMDIASESDDDVVCLD